MEIGTLTSDNRVENEECCFCYHDFDDPDGVNICLQCFSCLCDSHSKIHSVERGHTMFLNRKRITTKIECDPTKLAIGVEGGFQDVKYDFTYSMRMYDSESFTELPDEILDDDEPAKSLVSRLKTLPSSSSISMVDSWELKLKECEHVHNLVSPSPPLPTPHAQCHSCSKTDNLWMCLTCGYVGCGRRNFDGSGGNNHAVDHYTSTHHPLVVKLGTITPDGRGDLFCYSCDDSVIDSHLSEHLKQCGISVEHAVKTEKTTTEQSVELNKTWDFAAVTSSGVKFQKFTGRHSCGLKNLGNTCYMNSVLQLLSLVPSLQERFSAAPPPRSRWPDAPVQFSRLFSAMESSERPSVSPRLFRQVVCHGSADFLSGQQQDATEFLLYLMNYIEAHDPSGPLGLLKFDTLSSVICNSCNDLSTMKGRDQFLLMVTPPSSTNFFNPSNPDSPATSYKLIDLIDVANNHELPERKCDVCHNSGAQQMVRFSNFPDFLIVVVVQDTVDETGMLRKLNIEVEFDPSCLDIDKYRVVEAEKPKVDEGKVQELMQLGFTRQQSETALAEVGSVEKAVDWIMDHPMQQSPNVASIVEMGFTEAEAREALEETNGNAGLAIEWLFGPRTKKRTVKKSDGKGIYQLEGFIMHKGSSALCGHYVAVGKRNDKWILYNDEEVSVYPDDFPPPFQKGYIYLFSRK